VYIVQQDMKEPGAMEHS